MRSCRAALSCLVVLAATVTVLAQGAPTPAAAPAEAPPVLSLVPSGAMGFVVVNNVKTTMGNRGAAAWARRKVSGPELSGKDRSSSITSKASRGSSVIASSSRSTQVT